MSIGKYLFGAVFVAAGVIACYFFVISPVFDAARMQSWRVTHGQLISANVDSYQTRNDDGGYTTMYRPQISYQYQANNQTYIGDRGQLSSSSRSNSDSAYAIVGRAKHEQARNNSIKIWYNPNDPTESIYDKSVDVRFLLVMTLFSGAFVLVGAGVILFAGSKEREKKADRALQNVDTSKPWTTRMAWASPTIYSQAQNKRKLAWYFAILSCFFVGSFALAAIGEHPVATAFALVCLLLPAWLIKRAKRISDEWRFFQAVPITLNPYPGVVGGKVKGTLTVPVAPHSQDSYQVVLSCVKHWTTRSGNKTEHHQSVVWQEEQKVKPVSRANESSLSFAFDVPAEKPESSAPSKNYHMWTLTVKGALKGIDFDRAYEVPVFVTDESLTVEEELVEQPLSALEKSNISDKVSLSQSLNALSLHTPGDKSSLFIAGIGAFFFVSGVMIYLLAEAFFGVVFAGFSTIFLGLGIWGWGRNCKIRITANQMEVDVHLFSKLIKQHVFSQEEITEIEAFRSSSIQTNGKQTSESFSLRLRTINGKTVVLGGEFESKRNAVHMKQQIEQVMAG
ncbi:DUF3592 domain-containing protein [Thalassotalea fusca]